MTGFETLPHYEKPKDDNELLFNFQYEYKNGSPAALSGMYTKLYEVAYKAINARSRTSEKVAELSAAERRIKAHDAATYVIEQYLKRPDFVRTEQNGITGYLNSRINWELYGEKQNKRDQIITYTDKLPERNGSHIKYKYLVKEINTGAVMIYASAAELYLNPAFKGLRKKRLAESIRTGKNWKNYMFCLLEVME